MFNRYYQDELLYLRELGAEFARAHPTAAHFLAAPGSDPDVERMLEGFAFLSAKVRQKLDDEIPEVTAGLFSMLWPHYLRPVPSMSILEFQPVLAALRQSQTIRSGIRVQSVPVEGTHCPFQTAYPVTLNPLSLDQVQIEAMATGPGRLWLGFKLWNQAKPQTLDLKRVRVHLHGDPTLTFALYYYLSAHLREAWAGGSGPGARSGGDLCPIRIEPVGFGEEEALLPYPSRSFAGYRLLQEYFSLQEKFLFLDIIGLEGLRDATVGEQFWVEFRFDRPLPAAIRPTPDDIRLYCTPIVNLFPHESDPLRIDHTKVEYRVRPQGASPLHYEVYSIDRVVGYQSGSAQEKEIPSFLSFSHDLSPRERLHYYSASMREAVVDERADTFLSFVDDRAEASVPPVETISVKLQCTNRRLPEALRAGDIHVPTDTSPEFVRFRNLTVPIGSVPPPLGGDLHWRLVSHLSLNYLSVTNVEALRGILGLYNFHAMRDPRAARANALRLEGIQAISARPIDSLVDGSLLRGLRVSLELNEDRFAGDGDLYLFCTVLNEFLNLYASINSFVELRAKGTQRGEEHRWPARVGGRDLL